MAQSIEEFLLEAIEKDDVKAFAALMEQTQCGGYRLGRFPVLSVLYLYKSRKIISAFEEKFIKITAWELILLRTLDSALCGHFTTKKFRIQCVKCYFSIILLFF